MNEHLFSRKAISVLLKIGIAALLWSVLFLLQNLIDSAFSEKLLAFKAAVFGLSYSLVLFLSFSLYGLRKSVLKVKKKEEKKEKEKDDYFYLPDFSGLEKTKENMELHLRNDRFRLR